MMGPMHEETQEVPEFNMFKFQMDSTGQSIMAYTKGHRNLTEIRDPDHVAIIAKTLDLKPLTKVYAPAHVTGDGMLLIDADSVTTEGDF